MEPEKVTEREIRLGKFIFSTDKGKLSCEEYEISDEKIKKRWKKLWKIIHRRANTSYPSWQTI